MFALLYPQREGEGGGELVGLREEGHRASEYERDETDDVRGVFAVSVRECVGGRLVCTE